MKLNTLRRVHSFLGLVPLGAYLCFHAWEHWPVREGRDAAFARMAHTAAAPFELIIVILPLLAHAGLGSMLARQADRTRAYASPAFRRFQGLTGLVTALFLLWHIVCVWGPRVRDGGRPAAAYDAMLDQVGTALGASCYVVGLSAVCVHFGQGLSAAWLRQRPDDPARLARATASALAAAIWLALLNELAVYASGAPLL